MPDPIAYTPPFARAFSGPLRWTQNRRRVVGADGTVLRVHVRSLTLSLTQIELYHTHGDGVDTLSTTFHAHKLFDFLTANRALRALHTAWQSLPVAELSAWYAFWTWWLLEQNFTGSVFLSALFLFHNDTDTPLLDYPLDPVLLKSWATLVNKLCVSHTVDGITLRGIAVVLPTSAHGQMPLRIALKAWRLPLYGPTVLPTTLG